MNTCIMHMRTSCIMKKVMMISFHFEVIEKDLKVNGQMIMITMKI